MLALAITVLAPRTKPSLVMAKDSNTGCEHAHSAQSLRAVSIERMLAPDQIRPASYTAIAGLSRTKRERSQVCVTWPGYRNESFEGYELSNPTIRPAVQDDIHILWHFLAIASHEPNVEAARAVPIVAAHLTGWQREGDFGFIAERDGIIVGAAWARQFSPEEQPAFCFGECTPEISIAVEEHARGQGIGQELLRALIAEAARRGVQLCLNVRHDNPAIRLTNGSGLGSCPGQPSQTGWDVYRSRWCSAEAIEVDQAARPLLRRVLAPRSSSNSWARFSNMGCLIKCS